MFSDREFDAFVRSPEVHGLGGELPSGRWLPIAHSESSGLVSVLCLWRRPNQVDRASITWGRRGQDDRWYVDDAQDDLWFRDDDPHLDGLALLGVWGMLGPGKVTMVTAGRLPRPEERIDARLGEAGGTFRAAASGAFVVGLSSTGQPPELVLRWGTDVRRSPINYS